MQSLGEMLVQDCDALTRRWFRALRGSTYPRLELSEDQLEHKIASQLRTIGGWLDSICGPDDQSVEENGVGGKEAETIWELPERLDPEARVAQDVPIEEVVLQYGLLAKTVLDVLDDRSSDVALHEISLFFQSLIALIAETARRYTAFSAAGATHDRAGYLARLTHQMRTPLTVLKLQSNALLHSDSPPNVHVVHSIERNVKRLTALVDGVMRLERFKPDEIPVFPVEVAPAKLIDQVVEDNAYEAERKALRVEVVVNRMLRMQIDPTLFVDALGNLVQNAVKYTDSGQVRVEVEERETEVAFKVSDTGPGIATERKQRMFEPVEPDTTGGTGIGLTIVCRATQAQGGEVGVESTPGQGSIFWFTLPRNVKQRNVP